MKIHTLALAIGIAFSAVSAQADTFVENFNTSFPTWESGWLGTNSNLSNVYGVGQDRGNNPDGLWIGKTNIAFNQTFGASITTLDFDVASWINGTISAYNSSNSLISTQAFSANYGAYSLPGTYQHFSFASNSGISSFTFNGGDVLGNISIDNVQVSTVSAVPEPETYAMLIAGLGVMGAIARRRKQKASVV